MVLRVWLRFCLKRRSVVGLLSLFFLSTLVIHAFPPSSLIRRRSLPSEGLHSNEPNRFEEQIRSPPHLPLPPNSHSGGWKEAEIQDPSDSLLVVDRRQVGRRIAGNSVREKSHAPAKKHLGGKASVAKRRKVRDEYPSQPYGTETGERGGGRGRKPGHRGNSVRATQPPGPNPDPANSPTARTQSLRPNNMPCGHKCAPDGPESGKAGAAQQAVEKASGGALPYVGPLERKMPQSIVQNKSRSRSRSRPAAAAESTGSSSGWCERLRDGELTVDWNRSRAGSLPWFSRDDLEKMELLSKSAVLSKARMPGHGQVLRVGLGDNSSGPSGGHHDTCCQQGRCALIKRSNDWYEVFAYHLDRVLGLNRSLPVVLRSFHSDLLPYRYTTGPPRPVVWWDPDIQHLADNDNDQNSFSLTWPQYQALLRNRCGIKVPINSSVCVGVHHSEWGRLALLDFLLQVNDRLDRNCCGFRPDPSELCVENLLHPKCGNAKDLLLVHILVRKTEPSRLVFIDNAGRPHHAQDNLNYRLVEGIDEFPESAVSVLRSGGCLESLLLRSLSADREFWESRGGVMGIRRLVRIVEQRGRALLRHIQEKRLHVNQDL